MTGRERSREDSGERFRWFQIEILIVFAALILIVTAIIDFVILERSGRAMQQTASDLIAANSRQLELNINSYLERMETTSTLLFSNEAYYQYDATDESMDEYDKVKAEEAIKDRLVDIGLMENYSDFGIIYSDDHRVGWISHGTEDLFPEGGMYEAFSGYITNEKKNDGWCFGINGSSDRIYYIKRLNPNAIIVSAIYTKELSSVFIYPEQLEGMTIRLVDDDNTIMFSSTHDEIGEMLPDEIAVQLDNYDRQNSENGDSTDKSESSENGGVADKSESDGIGDAADKLESSGNGDATGKSGSGGFGDAASAPIEMSSSIISEDYIINTNLCSNNWEVICSIPTEIILKENISMRNFTLKASLAMAVLFVLIGLGIIIRISRPVDGMVTSLQEKAEIDNLSGVNNKVTFEENVGYRLSLQVENRISVLVMLDMDNFKQINDRLGHVYGDQVIIRIGKLLRRMYGSASIIGRMGGDEFAIFAECIDVDRNEVIEAVNEQTTQVLEAFTTEFEHEREQCGVSLSAGVYVTEEAEVITYEEMYDKADKALYISKNNGKNQYTFYDEEEAGDKL